jgi:hypothetical protein
MLDSFKVGDEVKGSEGLGSFYYQKYRDADHVIALAGGSGITPFLSMAYAIRDGIEDFDLTILFGSRTAESVLFRDEFDQIMSQTDKVEVIYVLSDEERAGFEHGFITADMIRKYAGDDTLDYNCAVVCSCAEFRPRELLERGKVAVVRGFDGLTLCVLDGCGKNVGNVLLRSFVYVDRNLAVLGNNDLNVIGDVNRPFDRIYVLLTDHDLFENVVIGGSVFGLSLHNGIQIFFGCLKTVLALVAAACKYS